MQDVQFYDLKSKAYVSVPASQVKKVTFERKTKSGSVQVRYGLTAVKDGKKLNKFVSKEDWDKIK